MCAEMDGQLSCWSACLDDDHYAKSLIAAGADVDVIDDVSCVDDDMCVMCDVLICVCMQYGQDACDIAAEECRWEIYDVLSYA